MRFFAGLIVGLLGVAGYFGYERYLGPPCGARCGGGTFCAEGLCLVTPAPTAGKTPRRRRRKGRGRRRASAAPAADAPTRRAPTAAEVRAASEGPSLNSTDYVDLTKGGSTGAALDEADITSKVRAIDPKVVACIDRARGDEVEFKAATVTLSFRIERSGSVSKVRVKAPALLMKQGLYRCVRDVVTALRFPASGRSTIMTYPYRLH